MDIARLRLLVKRNFISYYLQLFQDTVADPTDAYLACTSYLEARRGALGHALTDAEFEEENLHLAGEIEQDLARKDPGMKELLSREPVPDRLRECMTVGRARAG